MKFTKKQLEVLNNFKKTYLKTGQMVCWNYVKFSKTEEIDKPAEIIKGQLVVDQKEIIIKVLPEQKDYYKTNETYVFDLFNSQKK